MTKSSSLEIARNVAASLNLLDAAGKLIQLDSLTVVDYVVGLETELDIEIPTALLEKFTSLEAVAAVLDGLRA